MRPPKLVIVLGGSRTGTNLTAGVFAAHGFFFGDCRPANDKNPKGYFENLWAYSNKSKPEQFLTRLQEEGWEGQNVGIKGGIAMRSWVDALKPDLVVITERDAEEHAASTARVKMGGAWPRWTPEGPYKIVNTSRLMRGNHSQIADAFAMLGLPYDEGLTNEWIEPSIWNRGLTGNAKHSDGAKDRG